MLPLHSPVGGSGMGRWHKDHCPGSVAMVAQYPNLTGYEAQEGLCGHTLSETCLKTGLNTDVYHGHEFNGILVDDEMVFHIQGYIDFIRGILRSNPGTEIYIEQYFHWLNIHKLFYGVRDILLINKQQSWAWVIDLKYGRVPVPVTTPQLNYYSADIDALFDNIYQTIYQPRLYDRDENYETVCTNPFEVAEWVQSDLIPSIDLALSDNAPRRPGEWCRYCPGKLECPELGQELEWMKPPFPTTNDKIAKVLTLKPVLKNLIEQAEELAADRLMMGEDIPGF